MNISQSKKLLLGTGLLLATTAPISAKTFSDKFINDNTKNNVFIKHVDKMTLPVNDAKFLNSQ